MTGTSFRSAITLLSIFGGDGALASVNEVPVTVFSLGLMLWVETCKARYLTAAMTLITSFPICEFQAADLETDRSSDCEDSRRYQTQEALVAGVARP